MTFSGAILVSVVFWILDLRSGQLINVCQIAAAQLENPKGVFTALNALRLGASTWWASYGFAIDLLVAGVIGASAGGLYRSISRPSGPGIGSVAAAISVGMFLSIVVLSRRLRNKDWSSAKANSEAKAIPESVRY
jgi:hypothetical protein